MLCTTAAHFAFGGNFLMRHYDPVCTKLVHLLATKAKADIVLSSTWRISFDQCHMTALLVNAGMPSVPWHSSWRTPKMFNRTRGEEIAAWMVDHRVDRYVILDDDSDMREEQKPFHVKTDVHDGFGFNDLEAALKILGAKL